MPMRSPQQTVHSRTFLGRRSALFPLEGYPPSRLPGWPGAEAFVLASPALGAGFVQILVDLPAGQRGGWAADDQLQTFYYLLDGAAQLETQSTPRELTPGSFGLVPAAAAVTFSTHPGCRLLLLRKRYEPSADHPESRAHHGHESQVPRETWADNPASKLQTLIPDDPAFDLAVNIFTFEPGCGLPIVETHVMEHGLYYLQGRGLYYLEDRWIEVEADDFIYMGPYCPQSFIATGPTPSRYLYYKNVNREIMI